MHKLLFEHQTELSDAKYEEWAKQIGLDLGRWRKDKDSAEMASAIAADARYGTQVGADGTPAFFINGRLISGAMPFETFKPVIDEQIERANAALKKGVKPEKLYEVLVADSVQSAGHAEQQVAARIEVGNAPVLGPKNAPVTIVEWSDFQCPFCGRVEPTLQQLRDEYKGKIRIAWKNQPLSFHPNAMPAAEAAMAAHEQGKFWEFHDALFKKQGQLSPALYDEVARQRSEEHTSELQSLAYLVCRLLLEKKKTSNCTIVIVFSPLPPRHRPANLLFSVDASLVP